VAARSWQRLSLVLAVLLLAAMALLAREWTRTPPAPAVPAGLVPGSNEMLRQPLASIEGVEVIVSDVIIPPGSQVPRHYHPGEEIGYLISGLAVHVEEGRPDLHLEPGQAFAIGPEAVHAPRGGPEGARPWSSASTAPACPGGYRFPSGNNGLLAGGSAGQALRTSASRRGDRHLPHAPRSAGPVASAAGARHGTA
jgi:quercetin dioxygenase-like cupin family protein